MRAILITEPGAPGNMVLADVPEPAPGPGEVLVEVACCGCNFADTMMRRGTYPHPKGYPIVGGLEIAGRVIGTGRGVTGVAVGDRVAAFLEEAGGFAKRCVAPVERLLRMPDDMTFETGAALPIQALTAWHVLHTVSTTNPGDTILVHAIGGGLGLFATQIAVHAGATVIGTVGTRGKEALPLAYGAAKVVNREDEDFVAAVLAFTGGRGVDKVVDSTGASILDRSFAVVRRLGHVVSVGEAEGRPFANLWERMVPKSLTFTRFHLGHSDFAAPAWRAGIESVLGGVRDGWLQVPIADIFPFERASDMLSRLESRAVAGKLVLAVTPS